MVAWLKNSLRVSDWIAVHGAERDNVRVCVCSLTSVWKTILYSYCSIKCCVIKADAFIVRIQKVSHSCPNSYALHKMLNLYLLVMWRRHLLLSQFRIKSWSPKSAGPLRRENCQPCFPFLSFFGNYPRGFEVLIRQCWLIPAVHNLCYYWMITWDHGREEKRERARGWVKSEKKTCSSRPFQTDSPLH